MDRLASKRACIGPKDLFRDVALRMVSMDVNAGNGCDR
jgi:hypothetical protein